ncbi:MAG: BLUF domain-containing protein [Bacteroidota bacterium]
MEIFAVVYYSQAHYSFREEQLIALARKAEERNQRLGVTGFLQYRDGHFFQYLEGKQYKVLTLLGHIKRDPRHTILRIVPLGELPTRYLDHWHMRYIGQHILAQYDLIDLLHIVLDRISAGVYDQEILQRRILRLVQKISAYDRRKEQ